MVSWDANHFCAVIPFVLLCVTFLFNLFAPNYLYLNTIIIIAYVFSNICLKSFFLNVI